MCAGQQGVPLLYRTLDSRVFRKVIDEYDVQVVAYLDSIPVCHSSPLCDTSGQTRSCEIRAACHRDGYVDSRVAPLPL